MDTVHADILAARDWLQRGGWFAPHAGEAFRHLPPPALAHWLHEDPAAACNAAPLAGAGWTLHPLRDGSAGGVQAQWLDARDAAQRAQLLDGLPGPGQPGDDEAAPFAWAHRALCRQGLRLRIDAAPGRAADDGSVWLQLRHQPRARIEAPLLVLDVQPGVHCRLLETHDWSAASGCGQALTQNLQVHIRLAPGARLEHLRISQPGAHDQVAHHLHVRLARDAHYAQALVAGSGAYHLQRSRIELEAGAQAHSAALLLAGAAQIDHQAYSRVQAPQAHSTVETLALAQGRARVVANAHTHIAPGAAQANVRQRLTGIPLSGQPRLTLRPHLEILHDDVQAAHGATWGALPEDALFYAAQRGLDDDTAHTLVTEGMARALLEGALPHSPLLQDWLEGGGLANSLRWALRQSPEDAG